MPKSKIKSSVVWNFFTPQAQSSEIATCNLCLQKLNYKSTSNNLKKHIQRKHPLIRLTDDRDVSAETTSSTASHDVGAREEDDHSTTILQTESEADTQPLQTIQAPTPSFAKPKATLQSSITPYMKTRKIGISAQKKIDDTLMLLFIKDFQPFSVVEDYGFRKYSENIPGYQLPSRRTITDTLLPAAYETAYNATKISIRNVQGVTITTDCWTSRKTQNFCALTAHYVTENFEIKSVLLDCSSFSESHTSENLASRVREVLMDWDLIDKVNLAVSDNAANIKKALSETLRLRHFGCYAHTLNLIAEDALKHVANVTDKVKMVVGHFKRSSTSMARFLEQQRHIYGTSKKLIQSVPTRWNSTYYMLQRFAELEESIRTTMALLDKDFPIISVEEWNHLRELVKILKPLEEVTKLMSGQKYVTASSVIILTDGLVSVYSKLEEEEMTELALQVIKSILNGFKMRLGNLENSNSLLITTLLDPRFKNMGFSNHVISERAKNAAVGLVKGVINSKNFTESETHTISDTEASSTPVEQEHSVWGNFDKKVAAFRPSGTALSKAIIEVQRYLEEPVTSRQDDPIQWWRTNGYNYPNLSEVVKSKFIAVATSVPCERVFSKSGLILSDRRNKLGESKVKKILFLNNYISEK